LRRQNFDAALVNGYDYGFELQLRRQAASLDLPLVMRPELSTIPHQSRLRRIAGSLFRRWFYAGVSAFGVVGEQARRSLISSGVRPEKMFFSPYAVDADLFQSSDQFLDREGCRRRIGVPAGNFMLLFSGKLIPRKNPSLVLKALEQLPERPRVSFVVLGDGPDRGALVQGGTRVLGGNFLLAGFKNQSQLAPYFKAADALVLPSLYESWGLVVNEAMHFGLPVVISDAVSCAADLVANRDTGLLFRSNDAADLARALHLLIGNERLLRQFSQNARRVIRQYTPDTATKGVLDALDYAVTRNGCASGRMR
jgi:glycosyltransferase involved in cell wall biosynthesis